MEKLKIFLENLNTELSYLNKLKGKNEDNFNMFKICGVDHYENTHTKIIAEFLNPKGSHNLETLFLNEFIKTIKKYNSSDNSFDFNLSNVSVISQHHTEFGIIDLFIKNDFQCIIIENKIYAADQYEQLKRYNDFGKKIYIDNYKLIYLTLWGNEASYDSNKGVNYIQISYEDFIINWLEKCVEVSARYPIIRETLIQYINHIKYLTNTNYENKMNEELIKLFSKAENIESVFIIEENLIEIKNHIINEILLNQLDKVCDELGLVNVSEKGNRVSTSWAGFQFVNPKWKTYKIAIEFEAKGLRNAIFGICHNSIENRNEKTFEILKTKFKRYNQNWVWNDFPKYNSWDKNAFKAIFDGDMANIFKTEIEKILINTNELEM